MSSNRNESNDVVMFFVGLVMTVVGGYLFMQNVEVYAPSIFSFRMFGRDMDGLIFIPLISSGKTIQTIRSACGVIDMTLFMS